MGRSPREMLESLVGSSRQLRYLVVSDVGSTLSMRNYPRASFSELINILLERHPQYRVVMIRTQAERYASEVVLAGVRKKSACVERDVSGKVVSCAADRYRHGTVCIVHNP